VEAEEEEEEEAEAAEAEEEEVERPGAAEAVELCEIRSPESAPQPPPALHPTTQRC